MKEKREMIRFDPRPIVVRDKQDEQGRTCVGESYPLRVAYDAQELLSWAGKRHKGVDLSNLLRPYSDSFVGFATPGRSHDTRYLIIQEGLSRHSPWQQISLPYLLHKWRADFFVAPNNTAPFFIPKRTKLILLLYDLILLERVFDAPNPRQRILNEYRRLLVRRAVSRAHIVLTVSSYSRQQIKNRFPLAPVQVIPCSISPSWFVESDARKIEERENFILVVTNDTPHKNTNGALEGYARFVAQLDRFSAPRLRLVGLSGSAGKFRGLADTLHIGDLIYIEPYLTESQLQDLYRKSRAVLFPSFREGFGLPVLEAMASGTPVIASNATSLPEVGGPAAAYFDPSDVADMAAVLSRVLGSPTKQQEMIELGLCQARRFHPDIVGRQVLTFWDSLVHTSSVGTTDMANTFQEEGP
jgi:glycosyltransferase involved in cell wall biosynthesis